MCNKRTRHVDKSVIFDCRCCTSCCSAPWRITATAEKVARIKEHDWSKYPQVHGKTVFCASGDGQADQFDLVKDSEGRCVFLDKDGLCIIHKELGEDAKPAVCLQFPFLSTQIGNDDRISVNYGCPAVQECRGTPLTQYQDKIENMTVISAAVADPNAPWLLSDETQITPAQAEAFFDRAIRIFGDDREETIWARFAELLTVLSAVQELKTQSPADEQAVVDFLNSNSLGLGLSEVPQVVGWEDPAQAPMAVRLLFATTLYADTLTTNTGAVTRFFERLRRVPKLMALGQLSGEYNSLFLRRPINISAIMNQDFDGRLPEKSQKLLLRYYRSRFWQRFQPGTGMTIVAGVHQRIHDLNAILFFARALVQDRGASTLDDEALGQALSVVEFHFANQRRLHAHTLTGLLRSALDSLPLAAASLRLMASRQPVLETVGA